MANVIKFMSSFYRRSQIPLQSLHCARLSSISKVPRRKKRLKIDENNQIQVFYESVCHEREQNGKKNDCNDLLRNAPRDNQAASVSNNDILLGSLKSAPSASHVLELVNNHVSVMNNKHLMQALRSLFALQKRGESDMTTKQVLKHPHFEMLCKGLKRHAGAIELNETIEALKVVNFVGVGSDSTIVQVLLHLLKHQVNALSLHQIIFLDFLFSQMRVTPLIEALQIALPIVFEIQLPIKVDPDDITQLTDCLYYASKKHVSAKCIQLLVRNIMQYRNEIETKSVVSLLWSLCEFNADAFFEPLMKRLLAELILDIDSLSFADLETTLAKMASKHSRRHSFYYSGPLCDLVSNYVIDNSLGHLSGIYTLKKLSQFYHTNDALLNYVSDHFVKDESKFHQLDPMMAFNYINALALTDYRPHNWERIQLMIAKSPVFKNHEKRDFIWLRLAANLVTLNIYKTDVFGMVFSESYLRKIFSTNFTSNFENLLLIRQCIMTYQSNLQNLLPSEDVFVQAAGKLKTPSDFQLEDSLLHAFGGEKYVKTGVTTHLSHYIDHVVVLRKGGYPVAFATSNSPKSLDEINPSGDSQLLAIFGLGPQHFTLNSKRLRGFVAVGLRTLEKMGCTVIAINTQDWEQLADFERIPYIMRIIKSKTNIADVLTSAN